MEDGHEFLLTSEPKSSWLGRNTYTNDDPNSHAAEQDLDAGHLDDFFWFLAGLSAVNLAAYVWVARRYHA